MLKLKEVKGVEKIIEAPIFEVEKRVKFKDSLFKEDDILFYPFGWKGLRVNNEKWVVSMIQQPDKVLLSDPADILGHCWGISAGRLRKIMLENLKKEEGSEREKEGIPGSAGGIA